MLFNKAGTSKHTEAKLCFANTCENMTKKEALSNEILKKVEISLELV